MIGHSWIQDPVVRGQLAKAENLLRVAGADGESTFPLHRQLLSPRSKRLRPSLVLLAARLGQWANPRILIRAAAGIEILHEATLYHDDIVDEADLRRGQITTQRAFGPAAAALGGSELLYGTAAYFACLPASLRRCAGRAVEALCRGQLREIETIGDSDISVRVRLRIMRDKTARLFALAVRLGAELSGADSSLVRAVTRFGLHFGLCFQLADDLRDLLATEEALGRPPGADLCDGVYSLPILFALRGPEEDAASLRAALHALRKSPEPGPLEECLTVLRRTDGVRASASLLDDWIGSARDDLSLLRAIPLESLASFHALLDHVGIFAAVPSIVPARNASAMETGPACRHV